MLYGNNNQISDDEIFDLIDKFSLYAEEDKLDLDKQINNKSLSSGQMQKISFIRSLLNDSEILLLDEATSNLDDKTKMLIFDILKNEKITIINSTHNKNDFDYDYELKFLLNKIKRIQTNLVKISNSLFKITSIELFLSIYALASFEIFIIIPGSLIILSSNLIKFSLLFSKIKPLLPFDIISRLFGILDAITIQPDPNASNIVFEFLHNLTMIDRNYILNICLIDLHY